MGWVRDKIFGKLAKAKERTKEDTFYNNHHTLMKEYGWIPLEEYLALPMQTVNNLLHEINIDRKKEKKEINNMKKTGPRGRK